MILRAQISNDSNLSNAIPTKRAPKAIRMENATTGRAVPSPNTPGIRAAVFIAEDSFDNPIDGYQNGVEIELTQVGGTGATISWGGVGVTNKK